MMNYENTPLYTRSYSLTKDLIQRCAKFPRNYRFSLGHELEQSSLNLTTSIMTALLQPSVRLTTLQKADETLNSIRLSLRLSKDIGLINDNQHTYLATEIAEIGALLGSWKKRETTCNYTRNMFDKE